MSIATQCPWYQRLTRGCICSGSPNTSLLHPLRWIPYSQTLMTNSWSRTYHHRKWAILSTTLPMRRLWFPINYYKYYYKRCDKSWTSFKFEVWLFLIDTESEMYILYNKNDFITTVLLFKPPCIVLICSRVVQMQISTTRLQTTLFTTNIYSNPNIPFHFKNKLLIHRYNNISPYIHKVFH